MNEVLDAPFVCHLDGSVHDSVAGLHAVLKRFRVKQSDYWHEYAPRYNVATGGLIPYKTYDQYVSQDLESKTELKAWIKSDPVRAREWAIEWLRRRRTDKHLTYAPSQVELRTLMCPSMPYYDSVGGYYAITRELGYQDRYDDVPLLFAPLSADATIIQDTREQNPLKLAARTEIKKLDVGDYALAAPHDQGIYIERKSLCDMAGTLCKGNARFRRELERATKRGHYLIMLVESTVSDAQSLEYLPQTKHVRASSTFVAKQLRDLLTDFPFSFQAVFVDGRVEAARTVVKLFQLGAQVKTTDLQSRYERGEI